MIEPGAIHLMQWIEANAQAFLPPVANKEVFPESEFIFQIIRGPNARNDFHIDPGDEIFYQLAGDITVQIMDNGKRRDVAVREGEVFLCRAGTPHCPIPAARDVGSRDRAQTPAGRARSTGVVLRSLPGEAARGRVHLRGYRGAAS